MDLEVKSWLEKAKRLYFSVSVMLRSDSSDEFGESAKLHAKTKILIPQANFVLLK